MHIPEKIIIKILRLLDNETIKDVLNLMSINKKMAKIDYFLPISDYDSCNNNSEYRKVYPKEIDLLDIDSKIVLSEIIKYEYNLVSDLHIQPELLFTTNIKEFKKLIIYSDDTKNIVIDSSYSIASLELHDFQKEKITISCNYLGELSIFDCEQVKIYFNDVETNNLDINLHYVRDIKFVSIKENTEITTKISKLYCSNFELFISLGKIFADYHHFDILEIADIKILGKIIASYYNFDVLKMTDNEMLKKRYPKTILCNYIKLYSECEGDSLDYLNKILSFRCVYYRLEKCDIEYLFVHSKPKKACIEYSNDIYGTVENLNLDYLSIRSLNKYISCVNNLKEKLIFENCNIEHLVLDCEMNLPVHFYDCNIKSLHRKSHGYALFMHMCNIENLYLDENYRSFSYKDIAVPIKEYVNENDLTKNPDIYSLIFLDKYTKINTINNKACISHNIQINNLCNKLNIIIEHPLKIHIHHKDKMNMLELNFYVNNEKCNNYKYQSSTREYNIYG